MKKGRFDHIYVQGSKHRERFFTKSLVPGFQGFDETIVKEGNVTYREVDPKRSKLFAAIAKGVSQIGMRDGASVLYLGASHGYTPSFVSDIIGAKGFMLCIDVAPRVVRDLVFVCQARPNMAPLLADCRHPENYQSYVPSEGYDVVYQDIAQRDQVDIFVNNCKAHLKSGGFGLLAFKARSVDVAQKPKILFGQAQNQLLATKDLVIVDKRELAPLEKDHMLFVIKRR